MDLSQAIALVPYRFVKRVKRNGCKRAGNKTLTFSHRANLALHFISHRKADLLLSESLIASRVRLSVNLAGAGDLDLLPGLAGLRAEALDVLDNVLALDDLAEDDVPVSGRIRKSTALDNLQSRKGADVLAVEPGAGNGGDEELRAVGVLAGVGHYGGSIEEVYVSVRVSAGSS